MVLCVLVVSALMCTLVRGQPSHFYHSKPPINPNLEAYKFHHHHFTHLAVEIYYQGFTLIIEDDIRKFVSVDLHGNLNVNDNDENYDAQYYDVCEVHTIGNDVYWHYRNFEIALKHGDFFYFWCHVTEPSGREMRYPPGHFYVRNKTYEKCGS